MGIGGRVTKDAVHRDRQHGGATAVQRGPAKSSENAPVSYCNSFNRQSVFLKPLVTMAVKVWLLRDDLPKLCCPLDAGPRTL